MLAAEGPQDGRTSRDRGTCANPRLSRQEEELRSPFSGLHSLSRGHLLGHWEKGRSNRMKERDTQTEEVR